PGQPFEARTCAQSATRATTSTGSPPARGVLRPAGSGAGHAGMPSAGTRWVGANVGGVAAAGAVAIGVAAAEAVAAEPVAAETPAAGPVAGTADAAAGRLALGRAASCARRPAM